MESQVDPDPALPSLGVRSFLHQLNNQLTVVMAHAELAAASDDRDEMRRALAAIVEASKSMAETVRAFSRLSHWERVPVLGVAERQSA